MKAKKIVITGGPGTGKTSVIAALEKRGFPCVPEWVRSMTASKKKEPGMASQKTNPIVSVEDPQAFNSKLLEGRVAQYTSSENIASEYIFFDRGIPDVHAYMRCFGQDFDTDFEGPVYQHRYDKIYLMPPWKEIYVPDPERFETYEESEKVYLALLRTYKDFGYEPTLVPKGSIAERTDFILEYLEDT